MTQNSKTKGKIDKPDSIQIKSLYMAKDVTNKLERQRANWE